MKTYSTKASEIERQWHVLDATDKILGKLATEAAKLLMGKHKPNFTRHLDTGDFVVIINAEKVRFTGKKARQKLYHSHSGYPGGLKSVSLERMMATNPTRVWILNPWALSGPESPLKVWCEAVGWKTSIWSNPLR